MYEWILESQDGETQKAEKSVSLSYKKTGLKSQAGHNHRQLKERLERLQSSLDNLRLVNKYRVFDLEATRRENAYLKKLLALDECETS